MRGSVVRGQYDVCTCRQWRFGQGDEWQFHIECCVNGYDNGGEVDELDACRFCDAWELDDG